MLAALCHKSLIVMATIQWLFTLRGRNEAVAVPARTENLLKLSQHPTLVREFQYLLISSKQFQRKTYGQKSGWVNRSNRSLYCIVTARCTGIQRS